MVSRGNTNGDQWDPGRTNGDKIFFDNLVMSGWDATAAFQGQHSEGKKNGPSIKAHWDPCQTLGPAGPQEESGRIYHY